MKVVIALGANLEDPRKQVSIAIDKVRDIVKVEKVSSLYETTPFGVPDNQPNYINAILIGQSELKPFDLMRKLLEIENEMGRARSFQNAARIIDIDIIEYGGLFMESAELTLPHPRASQRRFVLEPWHEIDPDGELAGHGDIRQLLSQLQ